MITMTKAFDKTFPRASGGGSGLETTMRAISAAARTNQTACIEWADFARQSYAEGTATFRKLAAARTPLAALEIEIAYLKDSSERLMAQARILGDLYAGLVISKV